MIQLRTEQKSPGSPDRLPVPELRWVPDTRCYAILCYAVVGSNVKYVPLSLPRSRPTLDQRHAATSLLLIFVSLGGWGGNVS